MDDGHVTVTLADPQFPQNWEVSGLDRAGAGAAMDLIRQHGEMFRTLLEEEAERRGGVD